MLHSPLSVLLLFAVESVLLCRFHISCVLVVVAVVVFAVVGHVAVVTIFAIVGPVANNSFQEVLICEVPIVAVRVVVAAAIAVLEQW